MQAAKKEHARLLRQKAQNEQQLRTFQTELREMKKTKVRLMKQIKEEAAKSKQKEAHRNKEIAQLKKESRLRQMTIKNLETERRQREIVLKRKQEEVHEVESLLIFRLPISPNNASSSRLLTVLFSLDMCMGRRFGTRDKKRLV